MFGIMRKEVFHDEEEVRRHSPEFQRQVLKGASEDGMRDSRQ